MLIFIGSSSNMTMLPRKRWCNDISTVGFPSDGFPSVDGFPSDGLIYKWLSIDGFPSVGDVKEMADFLGATGLDSFNSADLCSYINLSCSNILIPEFVVYRRLCKSEGTYNVFTIDATFALGKFDVTPVMYRNLLLESRRNGISVVCIGPTLIHYKKGFSTYLFCFKPGRP